MDKVPVPQIFRKPDNKSSSMFGFASGRHGTARRRSFSSLQGAFATPAAEAESTGTLTLSPVERVKISLPGFSKISSFATCTHPLFPPGAFLVVSKTSHIGVVKIDESRSSGVSEAGGMKASAQGSVFGTSRRDKDKEFIVAELLHDINLNTIMVRNRVLFTSSSEILE